MDKIYVTGDIHGDPMRLEENRFSAGRTLDKQDVVGILGDFGIIWENEPDEEEDSLLDWLDAQPWTTAATLGNHENYDRIASLPTAEYFGGPVWVLRPSVFLLQSGYVYNICGKTVWNFNGAKSHDIRDGILDPADPQYENKLIEMRMNFRTMYRIKGMPWWEQEIERDPEVYERGRRNLIAAGDTLDFVWTHCCGRNTSAMMGFMENDPLVSYFDEIDALLPDRTEWYFGHYHRDEQVLRHHVCVYETIMRIA